MYTVGQVAKILGISRDALKFYEDKGLVNPTKDPDNGYRQYCDQDIYELLTVNYYRNLNVEVKHIQAMQEDGMVEAIHQVLGDKIDQIRQDIRQKEQLISEILIAQGHCHTIREHLNKMSVRPMKPMRVGSMLEHYFLRTGDKKNDAIHRAATLQHIAREIRFDEQGIVSNRIVEMTPADNLDGEDIVAYDRCIYTVIQAAQQNIDHLIAQRVQHYAERHHYQMLGIGYVSMLLPGYEDKREFRYLQLYIPIDDAC